MSSTNAATNAAGDAATHATTSGAALAPYDGIVLVSFGGPEGPEDVLPFMENVTRGRGIPRERLVEVSAHYQHFGGVSPINGQNRALLAAITTALAARGIPVPISWGNRNWKPFIPEALRQLRSAGTTRALAVVTSAFSSASGCRQYREDIGRAVDELAGDTETAHRPITVDKVRVFYNHPGFVVPMIDNVRAALANVDPGATVELVFTAHSIPLSMADTSDYVVQLREACRLIADGVNAERSALLRWDLVYQSRSGAPGQPWLEPDISDHLRERHTDGLRHAIVVPVGFISDHMEVVWDLDTQARQTADEIGLAMTRAATVGTDPRFVEMIVDLLLERAATERGEAPIREALGIRPANHDVCPIDCCPMPTRPGAPTAAAPTAAAPTGTGTSRPTTGRPS